MYIFWASGIAGPTKAPTRPRYNRLSDAIACYIFFLRDHGPAWQSIHPGLSEYKPLAILTSNSPARLSELSVAIDCYECFRYRGLAWQPIHPGLSEYKHLAILSSNSPAS